MSTKMELFVVIMIIILIIRVISAYAKNKFLHKLKAGKPLDKCKELPEFEDIFESAKDR